jgi:hypothetical protein
MQYTNNKMKSDKTFDKQLNQRRFMITLSALRNAGISLNIKSPSKCNRMYSFVCDVCLFITSFCIMMDMVTHRKDLVHVLKQLRMFIGLLVAVWTFVTLRYDTS